MKSYVKDMTKGNPTGLLLTFMLPMVVGNVFQQLYNMVDSMIVGKYVGADALAAVGATGSLNFLIFSLCGGMANGIGIIISQYFGAGFLQNTHGSNHLKRAIFLLVFIFRCFLLTEELFWAKKLPAQIGGPTNAGSLSFWT